MIRFANAAFSYNVGLGTILSGLSVELQPGGFYFLTGPSGSGKTTFLKMCYLALRPSNGELTLFGKSYQEHSRDDIARLRRRIGVVHQDCRFVEHLTVAQNIGLPLRVSGRDPARFKNDLAELMAWVGLRKRAQSMPEQLSGGERQRLALARAIITSPEIVLADEPTGNIDWDMGMRVMALLGELNKMNKTVLVATHDLALIRATKQMVSSARVLRLDHGHIVQAGADL